MRCSTRHIVLLFVSLAAGPARAQDLVAELSVVGTIRGATDPGFKDTVLLLDLVSGATHALTRGQCLPRLPGVCVREILDKTIKVSRQGELLEIAHIEGAEAREAGASDGDQAYLPPPSGDQAFDQNVVEPGDFGQQNGFDLPPEAQDFLPQDDDFAEPGAVPPPPMRRLHPLSRALPELREDAVLLPSDDVESLDFSPH